jgi:biopolymer transport protein ExbD
VRPANSHWRQGTRSQPELISAAGIRPRLEDYRRSVRAPQVLVTSDSRGRFGAAVTVLDEVRRAGIKQVSVETRSNATAR